MFSNLARTMEHHLATIGHAGPYAALEIRKLKPFLERDSMLTVNLCQIEREYPQGGKGNLWNTSRF